jgi:transposase-like protein
LKRCAIARRGNGENHWASTALTIRLHPLANASCDLAVRHLCAEINATETLFPGTELRLIYDLVSSQNL